MIEVDPNVGMAIAYTGFWIIFMAGVLILLLAGITIYWVACKIINTLLDL